MSKKVRITYRQHRGVTPEEEREALARVYRFVLDCHEKRKATEADDRQGEDSKNWAETNG